ncbi:tetratricopeptide repeat protein [Rubrivivax sp. RP6-9]|uniref:tetratricopeptide repeat protein n=1 Tax=Rubrivivax sp. RP6-9 TaxID=3415750 RepID=UPI003CC65D70
MAALLAIGGAAVRADEVAAVRQLQRSGDTAAALERAERAVAAEPRNTRLRFLHGVLLLDAQRDDAAMAVFLRLSEDYPELPEPFNNMALLHARAGRIDAARQALETALRNDPGHAVARRNLGDIHLRLALQAWETAAQQLPADAALQRKLQVARELAAASR